MSHRASVSPLQPVNLPLLALSVSFIGTAGRRAARYRSDFGDVAALPLPITPVREHRMVRHHHDGPASTTARCMADRPPRSWSTFPARGRLGGGPASTAIRWPKQGRAGPSARHLGRSGPSSPGTFFPGSRWMLIAPSLARRRDPSVSGRPNISA